MVAQSEAVMATGVALVMGAGIAAMAAVKGGRLGGGGGLDRARGGERPRYLLKGRGRGRVVTQRCFGPTRSLAARSAATLTVAASRAAHEHLSPTGVGEQSGSRVWAGAGGTRWVRDGRRSLGAVVRWLGGRKRAGPALHMCKVTARARGWVGRAPSDSISLSLPPSTAPGRSRPRGARGAGPRRVP